MRSALLSILLVVVILAVVFFAFGPAEADRRFNQVRPTERVPSAAALALHDRLLVADLHADALLWARDLSQRHTRGHVDLPRLADGNVAVQVFSVVTKSPWGQSYEGTDDDSDRITLLAVAQRWPRRTWTSMLERALHQARTLHRLEAEGHPLTVVRTAADLEDALRRRVQEPGLVAGVLAMEGLHALEGDLAALDTLYAAGYRMMAPTHMFDNEWAGSGTGEQAYGLTDAGRALVEAIQSRGIVLDLAHASAAAMDEVLAMATRPVVVSHTGVRGTCPGPRNLSDEHVRGVAATGGVVGIGFWNGAVCETSVEAIARAIRYTADLVGVEHVALGSDFDGTVHTPFDAAGLAALTDALIEAGFADDEIAAIMGGNALRVFRAVLPRG